MKLKICEVLDTTPDGVISLDPDFVPTYIQAHSSSYLLSCLKEVISMLATGATRLPSGSAPTARSVARKSATS